jgi:single-strand DNA-binding protein
LLTTETYRDENAAERERRAWHSVVVWGKRAEALSPFLLRGKAVAIEGRIVNNSWDGADGRRRHSTEIHAQEIVLLDRRPGASIAPPDRDAA